MMIFDPIRNFISGLDRKEFNRFGGAYIALSVLVVAIIFVRHVMVVQEIKSKIVMLNKSRSAVQEILTKFQLVEQQKSKVVEALGKDKKFNIQIYFKDLGTKLPVTRSVAPKFARKKVASGYAEESLALEFSQIDTKQLCELLQEFEQEPLVYIAFVDITRVSHARKFNVSMSIATLTAEQ
jgi:hypothetical protein